MWLIEKRKKKQKTRNEEKKNIYMREFAVFVFENRKKDVQTFVRN